MKVLIHMNWTQVKNQVLVPNEIICHREGLFSTGFGHQGIVWEYVIQDNLKMRHRINE